MEVFPDGQLEKEKGRAVVGGNLQNADDFMLHEISAPTANAIAFNVLFFLARVLKRVCKVVDVKTAFLNAYMEDPKGALYAALGKDLTALARVILDDKEFDLYWNA